MSVFRGVPGLQGPPLPPHGGSIEVIEDKDGLPGVRFVGLGIMSSGSIIASSWDKAKKGFTQCPLDTA